MDEVRKAVWKTVWGFLVGMVAIAAAIRLTWMLLAPALVPMAVLAVLVTAGYVLWSRR